MFLLGLRRRMEENFAMSSLYSEIQIGYDPETFSAFKNHTMPDKVLGDPNLSHLAKLLISLIITEVSNDKYPTNKYFADFFHVTERQIQNARQEIREQGYIGTQNTKKTSYSSEYMLFSSKTINKKNNNITSNNSSYDFSNEKSFVTAGKGNAVPHRRLMRLKNQGSQSMKSMSCSGSLNNDSDKGSARLRKLANDKPVTPQKPKRSKRSPTSKLSRKAKKIIELWSDRRFRQTDLNANTRAAIETLEKIDLLLSGNLYGTKNAPGVLGGKEYKGYKFSIAEIMRSMDRFELAVNDKYYHSYKKTSLKRIGLGDFFYNSYGQNKTKCYFLWFLENEPVPLFSPNIQNQKMYDKLVLAYTRFHKLPEDFKFKTAEISHLIDLSNKLSEYHRLNNKSLPSRMASYEYQFAMCYLHSALEYHNGNMKKITPYAIKGDWIFEAFPAFVSRHRFTSEWKAP